MKPAMDDQSHDQSAADAELARRGESPYSLGEKLARAVWMRIGQWVFSLTFHNWYGVRRAILRAFGAKVGSRVRVRPSVRIEQPWNLAIGANSSIGDRAIVYCLGSVTIGDDVSISQGAHLCAGTHDYRTPAMTLIKVPIVIGRDAWIAADAFVGPGVRVEAGAILGARGVAMKDLEAGWIYAGNPAVKIKRRATSDER